MILNFLPTLVEASRSERHVERARAARNILELELAEEWPAVVEKSEQKLSGADLDLHLRVMKEVLRWEKLEDWLTHPDAYRREHGFARLPGNIFGKDTSAKVTRLAVEALGSDAVPFVRRAAASLLRRQLEMDACCRGLEDADEKEDDVNGHVPVFLSFLTTEVEPAVRAELVALLGWVLVMAPEVAAALEKCRRKDPAAKVRKAAERALRTLRGGGVPEQSDEEPIRLPELRQAWHLAAGLYLRAYSRPRGLEGGVLRVEVAWPGLQKEVQGESGRRIRARLDEVLGPGCVKKIEVEVARGAAVPRPRPPLRASGDFRNRPKPSLTPESVPFPAAPPTATTQLFHAEPETNFDWLEECT